VRQIKTHAQDLLNSIKRIDRELLRSHKPGHKEKTQDREDYLEEVITTEDKSDVGRIVTSEVKRAYVVRAVVENPTISVGAPALFQIS
jgi:hypothetical protein